MRGVNAGDGCGDWTNRVLTGSTLRVIEGVLLHAISARRALTSEIGTSVTVLTTCGAYILTIVVLTSSTLNGSLNAGST